MFQTAVRHLNEESTGAHRQRITSLLNLRFQTFLSGFRAFCRATRHHAAPGSVRPPATVSAPLLTPPAEHLSAPLLVVLSPAAIAARAAKLGPFIFLSLSLAQLQHIHTSQKARRYLYSSGHRLHRIQAFTVLLRSSRLSAMRLPRPNRGATTRCRARPPLSLPPCSLPIVGQ